MFEYSIYSVITAEGCAAILWKDAAKAKDAAEALKVLAHNHLEAGIIDQVIPEPLGGAHRNHQKAAELIKEKIEEHLPELLKMDPEELIEKRYQKFRAMGEFSCEEELENA
jgi:acetyl-CoA carboxylase carboxyl transferase subunit alpha